MLKGIVLDSWNVGLRLRLFSTLEVGLRELDKSFHISCLYINNFWLKGIYLIAIWQCTYYWKRVDLGAFYLIYFKNWIWIEILWMQLKIWMNVISDSSDKLCQQLEIWNIFNPHETSIFPTLSFPFFLSLLHSLLSYSPRAIWVWVVTISIQIYFIS